ncbi:hypothetical protein [Streptomyces sp. NPDC092370]|uniref:hypothetical protein n=1 Tax=Streptomyces sp. NPDC092370 TaxID=3366016 RepID=UPI00381A9316
MIINASVGASSVVRDGHRAVAVQSDQTSAPRSTRCLIGGIGNDFKDEVSWATGSKPLRLLANLGEMAQVYVTGPIVGGVDPVCP